MGIAFPEIVMDYPDNSLDIVEAMCASVEEDESLTAELCRIEAHSSQDIHIEAADAAAGKQNLRLQDHDPPTPKANTHCFQYLCLPCLT